MNLYISPAIPDNVNHHLLSKQLQQELDLPETPNIYMTGELILLLQMAGALYITGHLTRGEYKRFAKGFDYANEEPFRQSYKHTMKQEQQEACVIQFDSSQYDHRELLEMVVKFFPHLTTPLPIARVGDYMTFCDSMEVVETLIKELGYE